MIYILKRTFLYLKTFWYHVVFYSFPTLEESFYTNLGTTYFDLGQYRKAISKFIKSEECNNGQDATFYKCNVYYLGYSYLNLGNHRQSVKHFEKYLVFEPRDTDIISYAAWCHLLLYQHEAALDMYLRLTELEPNKPTYHIEAAKILFELNRKDEAYRQLDSAKSLNHGQALNLLADSINYRFNHDLQNAIWYLENSLNEIKLNKDNFLYPQIGDIYILLSEYKKEAGDLEGTVSVLEDLYKITPDDYWALNCLAFEYADQDLKLEKALVLINLCLKYQPENSFYIDTKGWLLFKTGRLEEAKILIEKSLKLNPKAKDSLAHYGKIQESLKIKQSVNN